MKIETTKVTKIKLTDINRLDPIHIFLEDIAKGSGRITISCYGKAWVSYWGAIGDQTISEFFCGCNEEYLTEKLAPLLESTIHDIDKIRTDAEKKGVECWRDDPWNDYEFMAKMYGSDMYEWSGCIPEITNHEYSYLCRIIKAVQDGLNNINEGLKSASAT